MTNTIAKGLTLFAMCLTHTAGLGFATYANGALTLAHSDPQGSVIALTDTSGAILHTAAYGPHGQDWGATGTNPTPFTWLGGYGVQTINSDTPLRLYLTRHRVYSATLNRFLSANPLGLSGGLNLYAYGEGNPLMYIDPLGLSSKNVSMSGGFGQYMSDFGQMLLDYGDVVANTVNGLIGIVMSPSQSTMAAMNALSRPDLILENLWDNIKDAWNSGYRGQGQVFGNALITAATVAAPFASGGGAAAAGGSAAAQTATQLEFAFARGASVQTPAVTRAGEVFVRVGATEASTAVRAGSYAMPEATFNALGRNPAVLQNALDLPGAAPQYYRYVYPPAGTPIQRGIVPGGQFGGAGGYPEVIFPKGF